MRTGVARLDLPFFGGSHQTAAPPQLHLPKRADACLPERADACARRLLLWSTEAAAGGIAHCSFPPRRVRRAEACSGGA